MNVSKLKFKRIIGIILVFCILLNVAKNDMQGIQSYVLNSNHIHEFTETHFLWDTEWLYIHHFDGSLSIISNDDDFMIFLNKDGEVFVDSAKILLKDKTNEYMLLIDREEKDANKSEVSQSELGVRNHILTLKDYNDHSMDVDIYNENNDIIGKIKDDSISSYLNDNANQTNSKYKESENDLLFSNDIIPYAAIVVIPIAVILALLAVSVIVLYWTVITGPNPIIGNNNVRQALENLGSSAINLGKDLVNAVSVAFTNTINATNINQSLHTHHIVAKTAAQALPAREVLNSVVPIIGIESVTNLVLIRASLHSRLHTTAYYKAVNALLTSAENNRSIVVNRMNLVKTTLVAASIAIPN